MAFLTLFFFFACQHLPKYGIIQFFTLWSKFRNGKNNILVGMKQIYFLASSTSMCSSPINVRMHLSSIPSSHPLVTGYTCSTNFLLKLPRKALRYFVASVPLWHISTKHEIHTPVCISQSQGHLLPGAFFKLEIHLLT